MADRPEGLTTEEWNLILELRQKNRDTAWRNTGLQEAASLADQWADECCGGSGQGGEGYRNLATAIRRLMR
jgi:hypothetical protein